MDRKKEKNIIVFISRLQNTSAQAVERLALESGESYRTLLILDSEIKPPANSVADITVTCNLAEPESIRTALAPYEDELCAITCRGEASIARFQRIIPNVPYLRTPTTESLLWTTDKYLMRRRLQAGAKSLTPKFSILKTNSKEERAKIISKVGFPMIIKPTTLSTSLLVSICYHEEELQQTLKNVFKKLNKSYKDLNRLEDPLVIAEQFMEGDMYSVDSYVGSRGKITHCPMVRVKTGRDIGRDDFFGYLQLTPAALKASTVERAHKAAEQAIHALGLRSTTVHTELMKIDDEWKIIEIGARMGGFRHELYNLSCDIDHARNDIAIRMPKKVVVPKKCKGFACAMKWYAETEGVILEMKGIKKIESLASFTSIKINKKIGDRASFSKNGGKSVFNLFLYNADRSKLLADIRRVEKMVDIKIAARGSGKKKEDKA